MTTQEILQGVHDWTNGKIVYDISVAHPDGQGNPTKYADLAAALGTNGANIPQNLRKGGMSVKYVQSSDNKYVQYRLMSDSFTTDITQWAICEEEINVNCPEFVYVETDSQKRILFAFRPDGSVYYGAGCPQQVKDYIQSKLDELPNLDDYDEIVAFLQYYLGQDTTLKTLLDNKVNIEEGKSLINEEFANSQRTNNNPEWADVTLDAEQKILEGIKNDGTKVINIKTIFNGGIDCHADIEPTKDSNNLITSGAVYNATVNKSAALTNNAEFNTFVKEICGLKRETITKFAVMYARQTGNSYYNALYAYTTEGNFSVFQDIYRTQQECIDNNYGVKWNPDLNIGCVIDYRSLEINTGLEFNNLQINIPLELPYMPTLHNYHANEVMMKDKSFYKTFFDNAICIGDSVTEGNIDDYPNHVGVVSKYSYPSVLAKLTGWTVENAGESGITTKQWWDGSSQTHQAYFSKYDFQDYEIAFNALGNNGDLTDTLSEDTFDGEAWAPDTAYSVGKVVLYNKLGKKCIEAHTSSDTFDESKWTNAYLDYADTQTGCYCKIIEGILIQNPKIIIALVIGSNFDITKQTVVKEIGERYGLPVVDCTESSYITLAAKKYHGFHSGSQQGQGVYSVTHFNAVGYAAMAPFIIGQFFKYLDDNTNIVRSSLNYNI